MTIRIAATLFSILMTAGCQTMKPADFKTQEPRLVLEEFFAGKTRAWGLFEDRFGTVRRQFAVDITGTWDGEHLMLDERFRYDDGERDRRVWNIKKGDEGRYEGRADDVIGTAVGRTAGNALNWQYEMDLPIAGSTLRVRFDDWMFLQTPDVLINRARVSKLGIEIGSVTLIFVRAGAEAAAMERLSRRKNAPEHLEAASR